MGWGSYAQSIGRGGSRQGQGARQPVAWPGVVGAHGSTVSTSDVVRVRLHGAVCGSCPFESMDLESAREKHTKFRVLKDAG